MLVKACKALVLTSARATDNWVTVPTNSTLTIHNQTVLIHPILDEHYVAAPAGGARSPKLVRDKGQMSPVDGVAALDSLTGVAVGAA